MHGDPTSPAPGSPDPAAPAPQPAAAPEPLTEAPVRSRGRSASGVGIGLLGLLAAILFKGKGLLLLLLAKGKSLLLLLKLKSLLAVLKTGGSMLVMVWLYAMMWPLPFAVGFVLLILVHEMGHAVALRMQGIPFSAPLFIPFVGALIGMKRMPADAGKEALVAFGGPFAGTVGAQVCLVLYGQHGHPVWLGLAQVGYLLNLFNMAPYSPLDGGRIVGAISPKIWIAALPLMLVAAIYYHSVILIIVTVLGVPRAIKAWRQRHQQPAYFQVSGKTRLLAALGYVGLAAFLALMMHHAHQLAAVAGIER